MQATVIATPCPFTPYRRSYGFNIYSVDIKANEAGGAMERGSGGASAPHCQYLVSRVCAKNKSFERKGKCSHSLFDYCGELSKNSVALQDEEVNEG